MFGIGGMLIIIVNLPLKKKKKEMKDLLFGILCIILSISTVIYYTYVTTHPQIKYFEGSYDQVIRHKTFSGNEFVFKDSEGTMGFYISLHSKEKIYPNDFEEGVKYRIFYEDRTSIIVKVEKLGP